jgi:hypothetical protein
VSPITGDTVSLLAVDRGVRNLGWTTMQENKFIFRLNVMDGTAAITSELLRSLAEVSGGELPAVFGPLVVEPAVNINLHVRNTISKRTTASFLMILTDSSLMTMVRTLLVMQGKF